MKNTWFKRKKYIISGLFILMMILALATNPTKESYMRFWENEFGEEMSLVGEDKGFVRYLEVDGDEKIPIRVEKINFYVFSTYTPIIYNERGVTHLGIFGKFIRISKGQFDYPKWLELFN
ncbi:hypothetical protein J2Z44_002280 [Clostridium punense]|uniref:DUF3139 domain-containing protein n=1 Tax=Clostridium punense TaxID=1054297 RepID=A0ABS4K764_9CLOT|nr:MULTISPECIES: hypothetical protein [Clostridium]EQB85842.1 hypothetical protein M918_17280 [Clostridium sp. BL8]MBP2022459.1 hypothetical protein [Clostridium punense]